MLHLLQFSCEFQYAEANKDDEYHQGKATDVHHYLFSQLQWSLNFYYLCYCVGSLLIDCVYSVAVSLYVLVTHLSNGVTFYQLNNAISLDKRISPLLGDVDAVSLGVGYRHIASACATRQSQ